MSFQFALTVFEETVKKQFVVGAKFVSAEVLRYWFMQAHASQGALYKSPVIDTPYKSEDRKGYSITPLRLSKSKPKITVLPDKTWAKADLYYGDGTGECDEEKGGVDAAFNFHFHTGNPFIMRNTETLAKDAGAFFRSINMLSVLENKEKFFVYVFDETMKRYYDEKRATLSAFSMFQIESGVLNPVKTITPNEFGAINCRNYGKRYDRFWQAFSVFSSGYAFSAFGYAVDVLYSAPILENEGEQYYMIIGRVR